MPWAPELFSAPVLAGLEERRRHRLSTVPFFDGLMTGELDALVGSFVGEPELHHPVRGRIRGARAFEAYFDEMQAMFTQRIVSVEDVERVVAERRGFEEAVVQLDGEAGRVGLPVAIVADKESNGRIAELRMYYSSWPLTGRHANRPPVLQPNPELRESDVVAEHQAALAAGDVEAIVAHSNRAATPASRRAASTYMKVPMVFAPSTSGCSPTTAASRWSTARSSTTGARARWSTTSCGGARRS
jgi:hypothetical protein